MYCPNPSVCFRSLLVRMNEVFSVVTSSEQLRLSRVTTHGHRCGLFPKYANFVIAQQNIHEPKMLQLHFQSYIHIFFNNIEHIQI